MEHDNITSTSLDAVIDLVGTTLGLGDRARDLGADTPLLGAMPELDSMAVLELVSAVEDRFGFEVDDSDVTGEVFETVGSLADFVDRNRT
jgi:acyl carrier protein